MRNYGAVGLNKLTETERVIALAGHVDFEVLLGGTSTFYYNTEGKHSVEAIDAPEKIGTRKAANAIRRGNLLLPPRSPNQSRDAWYKRWHRLANDPTHPFSKLDDVWYGLKPDVDSKLCLYIEKHIDELAHLVKPPSKASKEKPASGKPKRKK